MSAAKSAINNLKSHFNQLHPEAKDRIQYLKDGQSNYPLRLFIRLNLLWLLTFAIPSRFNISLFVLNPWAEIAFIILNIPLIIFILNKTNPQKTLGLSTLAGAVMLVFVLLHAAVEWLLFSRYSLTMSQSYLGHIGNSLSWYHLWFITTLIITQWPGRQRWKTSTQL